MGLKGYFSKKGTNLVEGTKKTIGAKTIVENFEYMKGNLDDLVEGAKGNFKIQNPNLTFDETIKKYEITPEMLVRNYKSNILLFYSMLVMFFITFALFVFYLTGGSFIPAAVAFIVSGVPIAKMFEASVNCYRIRQKNFVTVKQWFEGKEFIPPFNMED